MKELKAGVLLPIFSIPSDYGIGTFGDSSYKFIDFLKKAGQSYLQILPLGETTFGDSPYSSISNYAGSFLYIDPAMLVKDKLLTFEEAKKQEIKLNKVDYSKLKKMRMEMLEVAYQRFDKSLMKDFIKQNAFLKDYAIYKVLKEKFNDLPWNEWSEYSDYSAFNKDKFIKENSDRINFFYFVQYLFFKQWFKLKEYANKLGIKIIGDVPIYSSYDSVDVWSNTSMYKLDENLQMKVVSGCPSDEFSKDGQVCNNPNYNYSLMKKDNYKFLIDKFRASLNMFDIVRLDHFRGYEAFWQIKAGSKNGVNGRWVKGPDMHLFKILNKEFGNDRFIAEDLGFLTENVELLLKNTGYPGMKVLEFGFDGNPNNKYLTHNYPYNCVAYSGTHDNNPIMGWLDEKGVIEIASKKYDLKDKNRICDLMINDLLSSDAHLVIIQLQDYMHLGESSRINVPSTVGNNWCYRLPGNYYNDELIEYIYNKTKQSSRL